MRLTSELRVRLAAGGVLALVFVAGSALGYAVDRDPSSAPDTGPAVTVVEGEVPPQPRPERVEVPSEWIIDRLDLDDEQRSRVDSVIEHFGHRMSEIQKAYRPRYRAVVDSTDRALRRLLTEEQRAQYDSMQAVVDQRGTHDRVRGPHR